MDKKIYYIIVDKKQKGPYTLAELGDFGLEPSSRIFCKGSGMKISKAEDIPEIKNYYFSGSKPAPTSDAWQPPMSDSNPSGPVSGPTPSGPVSNPNPPVAELVKREWHLQTNDQRFGPLTINDLKGMTLTGDSYVWREGMGDWVPASSVPELAPYVVAGPVITDPGSGPGNPAEDEADFGSPNPAPITGLILSLVYLLFSIYTLFGVAPLDAEEFMSSGEAAMTIIFSFLPALGFAICGLVNGSQGSALFTQGFIKKACKKSGAATAYGWSSIAISVLLIIFCIILLLLLDSYTDPYLYSDY